MDFSEDWKSLWPISSIFSPPLLLPNEGSSSSKRRHVEKNPIGPLIFNPCQETLTQLLNSPSLAPRLPPPYPDLTLPRFILTSSTTNQSIASTIASNMGPQVSDTIHNFNALQLLHCPKIKANDNNMHNTVLAFFPTGDNYDQLGFTMLNLNDSKLNVKKFKDGKDFVVHSRKLNHRILRLLVNPVTDFDCFYSSSGNYYYSTLNYTCIGYIMVCTMYSVHWYSVKMPKEVGSIVLDYAGYAGVKLFQGSAVVHACWSPHLHEECVVLLESGKLFLFDVSYWLKNERLLSIEGKKLSVSFDNLNENERWLSCEFSWHPRILVVAHSSAVFLVDLRFDKCEVCTLLKIELFSVGKFDRFVALSRSDSSGFCFAAASNNLLLLCDVRKPSMPVLQWTHSLQNPEYVTVFQLSELRPITEDDNFKWASESGHCILLGSFWNCGFVLFCYGPDNERGPVLSEISTFCNSIYSWGLPSELSLSGRDCFCGSCLIRRDCLKDLLPDWIDWKQKKDIILGFGILENDLHVQWDNCEKSVGFSLIRLMSSGKLEAQRYSAAWEFDKILEAAHEESTFSIEDNFLYDIGNGEDKLQKKHEYLKIEFLKEYLNGNVAKIVSRRQIQLQNYAEENQSKFHQEICEKLKTCGITALRSPQIISDMLKDTRFPTSIHEISLKSIWGSLPMNLLALVFSACKLSDPHLKQKRATSNAGDILVKNPLPFPFGNTSSCSDKTSEKVQLSNALVSPVLPTHILILLRDQQLVERDILPVDDELRLNCDKVMEAVHALQSSSPYGENPVSLADDTDSMPNAAEKLNILGIHRPTFSSPDVALEKSEYMMYETFVYQKRQEPISDAQDNVTAAELFDEGCPLQLKFDGCDFDLTPTELDLFQQLKTQDLNFQRSFQPYQEYLINSERFL
nr:Serine/threonine-protein kinase cdc7 [Ipomoea batatas]